jgi:hypothetical protein
LIVNSSSEEVERKASRGKDGVTKWERRVTRKSWKRKIEKRRGKEAGWKRRLG